MSANQLCKKAEKAVADYLRAQTLTIASASIYEGIRQPTDGEEEDSNDLPRITVYANGGDEAIPNTGIYSIAVDVDVEHNADLTSESDHADQAGEVFDLILTDSLATDISTHGTDFTALAVVFGPSNAAIDGRRFKSSVSFTLHCCGSDIAP